MTNGSGLISCQSRKLLYSGILIRNGLIVAGTIQNDVEVWDGESGRVVGVGRGHSGSIFCLYCEGEVIYSGSDDRSLRIWSMENLLRAWPSEFVFK